MQDPPKQASKLVGICQHFSGSEYLSELHEALFNIMLDEEILDGSFAKEIFTVWMNSMVDAQEMTQVQNLAKYIHGHFGSIQGHSINYSLGWKILTETSLPNLTHALIALIDECLTDIEWLVNQKLLEEEALESQVFKRISCLIRVLSEMAQCCIPRELSERFLKTTTKVYKLVATLARLVIVTHLATQETRH